MVNARIVDVCNQLALNNAELAYCTCFKPNCSCGSYEDDVSANHRHTMTEKRRQNRYGALRYGSAETPAPVECLTECGLRSEHDYGARRLRGSQPAGMVISASKRNTNYFLVPVNVSKNYVHGIYERSDGIKFAALNDQGTVTNNLYWRDAIDDEKTTSSEHLTAVAALAYKENDNHVQGLLDRYAPQRQRTH